MRPSEYWETTQRRAGVFIQASEEAEKIRVRQSALLGEGLALMIASHFSCDSSGKAHPIGAKKAFPELFEHAEPPSQAAAEVAAWEKFFTM